MLNLVLERFAYSYMGVFGQIELPSGRVVFTVERAWCDNKPRISCIPEGSYRCAPKFFNSGGYDSFGVLDVPGRSHILFHIANTADELEGCIGVGRFLGCVRERWGVVQSRRAFRNFMNEIEDELEPGEDGFALEIVSDCGCFNVFSDKRAG